MGALLFVLTHVSLPLMAQDLTGEEPTPTDSEDGSEEAGAWPADHSAKFLAEAYRFNNRLGGVSNPSQDAAQKLIARGEDLLRDCVERGAIATPKNHGQFEAFTNSLDGYRRQLGDVFTAVERTKKLAVREALDSEQLELPENFELDPWGACDQETHFFPRGQKVLHESEDLELAPVPADALVAQISPAFRLAEVLGVGANRLRWTAQYVDPILAREKNGEWRMVTLAKLRIEIWGEFGIEATEGDAATTNLEAFRRSVVSLRRSRACVNQSSSDVASHRFTIKEDPVLYQFRALKVWTGWNLWDRMVQDGRSWGATEAPPAMKTRIETALENLQLVVGRQVADASLADLDVQLETGRDALRRSADSLATHSGDFDLLVQVITGALPSADEVRELIKSGNLGSEALHESAARTDAQLAELRWRVMASLAGESERSTMMAVAGTLANLNRDAASR